MTIRRTVTSMALASLTAVLLGGCSTPSAPGHDKRLRTAAGISTFRIVCSNDLWQRTGGAQGRHLRDPIPAKITRRPDGLVTVELSGPNLVDLLEDLDRAARPDPLTVGPDPLADRMYDAIAPRLDTVRTGAGPGSSTPEVVIDDRAGRPGSKPTASPSPSASTSPTKSKK